MGYNPYRKENGEFATKEEAGAKAGSDYDSAVSAGDNERAQEIGDYVVEHFPKSGKAQEILTSRYNPLGGAKKRSAGLSERFDVERVSDGIVLGSKVDAHDTRKAGREIVSAIESLSNDKGFAKDGTRAALKFSDGTTVVISDLTKTTYSVFPGHTFASKTGDRHIATSSETRWKKRAYGVMIESPWKKDGEDDRELSERREHAASLVVKRARYINQQRVMMDRLNDVQKDQEDLAALLHSERQKERGHREQWVDDGNGSRIDIANTKYENLPEALKKERRDEARSALVSVINSVRGDGRTFGLDAAAYEIYKDRQNRNGDFWVPKESYEKRSGAEREPDWDIARRAGGVFGLFPK